MAGALSGDIKVPVVGQVPKVALVAGVGGVIVLIYLHNRKANSTAAPSSGSPAADPYPSDGTIGNPNDPNSVDPTTGVTYGDESVGYVGNQTGTPFGSALGSGDAYPWDGTYNNSNDPYSMDTSTGQTFGDEGYTGGGGGGGGQSGPPFSTNAQWSQYAENYLTSDVGLNAATVSAALGLYITGGKVTSAQEDVINQAVAFAGYPPVSGPNGKPPGINVGTTKTGQGQVTVPNVIGKTLTAAEAALHAVGLNWTTSGGTVGKRSDWIVSKQTPKNGSRVASGATIHLTVKAPKGKG